MTTPLCYKLVAMSDRDIELKASLADLRCGANREAIALLDRLAAGLLVAGFQVLPRYDGDPPYLRVINPLVGPLLGETIGVTRHDAPAGEPAWVFRWSWTEILHNADDIDGTVTKISQVLAATQEPPSGDAG